DKLSPVDQRSDEHLCLQGDHGRSDGDGAQIGDLAEALPDGYVSTVKNNRLEEKCGAALAALRNDTEALRATAKVTEHEKFIFGKGPRPSII
ncbi:MAG: hypothetical protein RQ724_00875, partial [Desulfuromonadales bacterium]|nr:hypothetical protein [Desulfuromonadales bacterium]